MKREIISVPKLGICKKCGMPFLGTQGDIITPYDDICKTCLFTKIAKDKLKNILKR